MSDQAPLFHFLSKDEGNEVNIYLSSFHPHESASPLDWFVRTGQIESVPLTMAEYLGAATAAVHRALEFHANLGKDPKAFYFHFMGHGGDPFLNKTLMDRWTELSSGLITMAEEAFPKLEKPVKLNIMTIMTGVYAYDENGSIVGGYSALPFEQNKPEIHYGMYSTDAEFRRRWLPMANPYKDMLRILADYKDRGGKVRLQGGYILGHNDSLVDVQAVYAAAKYYRLEKKFNIIHLQSPDETKWMEAELEDIEIIKAYLEAKGVIVKLKGFPT